jgi:hypothetical protein
METQEVENLKMEDIVCTIPYQCGDRECGAPGGWHKANYWICSDGTYSYDSLADGDHDPCDESDVPTADETKKAWGEYHQWVYKHGLDPLNEFFTAGKPRRKTVKYLAWFKKSILGWVLIDVRRGGKQVPLSEMPSELVEYLCVSRKGGPWVYRDEPDLDTLGCKRTRKGLRFDCPVEFTIEPSDKQAARELRAVAGECLGEKMR